LAQENHATVKLDFSVTSREMKNFSEGRIQLRNLQILKKVWKMSSQFLSSEQPCEPKSLDVTYCLELDTLGTLAVAINTGGHSILVLNERSVSDSENLCPLWLVILKSVSYSVGDLIAATPLGRGYSQKNWVGVCGPPPKTLTLFITKIYDIPYPIYDLTKNSKPYL